MQEKLLALALTLPLLATSPLSAQDTPKASAAPEAKASTPPAPPAQPGTAGLGGIYGMAQKNIVKAAEKMPEEAYAFKPSPDVRSFGQLVGHLADAQFMMCSLVLGEKVVPRDVEKTKTSKADLVAALKESCAFCERAYKITDADAAKPMELFGMKMNGFAVLGLGLAHGYEHYGNMVTYMRIKGIVPPSSEPRTPPAEKPTGKTEKY